MTNELERVRRVATYERVSTEDQRDKQTIKTQTEELVRRFESEPRVKLVGRYADDGISGAIPLAQRPEGGRLMRDAAGGLFDEIWVYKLDRLGRDDIDPLIVRRDLEVLGVTVNSLMEGHPDQLTYHVLVAVAAQERRSILDRTKVGLERAAREGRYTGGVAPMGYVVDGVKNYARLALSTRVIWGDWTEAELVVRIYQWIGIDGWSCKKVATHLNALGVPSVNMDEERWLRHGVRKTGTSGLWRHGRIRNIVLNPVYRGEMHYGKRLKKGASRIDPVIKAAAPRLVSDDLWHAANETIQRNRIIPRNTDRIYLLRSVMVCGVCGANYGGAVGDGSIYYRCNRRATEPDPAKRNCVGRSVRAHLLEPIVWGDIERFLRNPGELLDELRLETGRDDAVSRRAEERAGLESALLDLQGRRKTAIDLRTRGRINDEDLDAVLDEIGAECSSVEERLSDLACRWRGRVSARTDRPSRRTTAKARRGADTRPTPGDRAVARGNDYN